jgi:taurine dioxygenase
MPATRCSSTAWTNRRAAKSGFLFPHQERAEYLHAHHWSVGDIWMWDNIGTVHSAVRDCLDDEPRYMRRVQVMATLDYQRILTQ